MNPFRVESSRLLVRAWRETDRPELERTTSDSEMMRYVSHGKSWTASDVDEFLQRQQRHLDNHGYCIGAMTHRDDDQVIGLAGLQPLGSTGETELAWWVWKAYWGRGYATEAARAMVEHAFNTVGLSRLVAIVDPPNLASIRVMEKLGMHHEGRRNAHELEPRHPDIEVEMYVLVRE